jgi:FkbM family methyltransferase
MNISSAFRILAEASSDFPTLVKKLSNPSLVSFVFCKNLKAFANSDRGRQIDRIIDVGANEGQFAFMARYAWPSARIDCFEPDPDAFSRLKENHGTDNLITFYDSAVGSESKELLLNLGETSAQNSLLREHGKSSQGTIRVPVKILDEIYPFVQGETTLLKIDVQGYELEVLKGSQELLKQVKFVLLEISLEDLFEGGIEIDTIWSFMRTHKYKYHSIIDQYQDRYSMSQRIVQMDVIFEKLA